MDEDIMALLDGFENAYKSDEDQARESISDTSSTMSSLVSKYLSARCGSKSYSSERAQVPSLTTLAIRCLHQALAASEDVEADLRIVVESLSFSAVRQVVRDGGMPYTVLRTLLRSCESLSKMYDVDEAVLENERCIRSRPKDGSMDKGCLVRLENLAVILANPTDADGTLKYRRKDPPIGGFELLDEKRKREIVIHADSQSFRNTFHRITRGILTGLDWSNILVAGDMALTTLMHVDSWKDDDDDVQNCDIDIYIYGLDAESADAKVEHIFDIWSRNLPADNQANIVVKDAKTIDFLADYPNRRIQIVLILLPSPIDVLLSFNLDPCAIGFDGHQVLMLPRCARAIETGYSTFTMDLIRRHYLDRRRCSEELRLFKYAKRGFGLRFLPSYVKALEGGSLVNIQVDDTNRERAKVPVPRERYASNEAYRKPNGNEPGLKTMKRVGYLGQDFTNRFAFGITPLTKDVVMANGDGSVEVDYEGCKRLVRSRHAKNDALVAIGLPRQGPTISLSDLDDEDSDLPSYPSSRGMSQFELFVRHCEAWRLNSVWAQLDLDLPSGPSEPSGIYGDDPELFYWTAGFHADHYADTLERSNEILFHSMKEVISRKLGQGLIRNGYRGYLTRRVRWPVYGPDLRSVMTKQVTLPVMIPHDLEEYIASLVQGHEIDGQAILIPAYNTSAHAPGARPAIIPPLRDTVTEEGNLRYWVITNRSMWAYQDRVIDEVFEVLWHLFNLFYRTASSHATCASPDAIRAVIHSLRYRPIPAYLPPADDHRKREVILFRAWILAQAPVGRPRAEFWSVDGLASFSAVDWLYPVPDELFWEDGDEGSHDGEGVPQWKDVAVDPQEYEEEVEEYREWKQAASKKPWWWKEAAYRSAEDEAGESSEGATRGTERKRVDDLISGI